MERREIPLWLKCFTAILVAMALIIAIGNSFFYEEFADNMAKLGCSFGPERATEGPARFGHP